MFPIRTILHPTDFSVHSKAALAVAESLARDYNAELIILHAAQLPITSFGEGMIPQVPEDYLEQARTQLLAIQPHDRKVRVQRLFMEGNPTEAILQQARQHKADLIVMGTHGWTGLVRVLMGSVAEQVLRKASCPVLTVRMPTPESQPQAAGVASGLQSVGKS